MKPPLMLLWQWMFIFAWGSSYPCNPTTLHTDFPFIMNGSLGCNQQYLLKYRLIKHIRRHRAYLAPSLHILHLFTILMMPSLLNYSGWNRVSMSTSCWWLNTLANKETDWWMIHKHMSNFRISFYLLNQAILVRWKMI